MLKTHDPTKIAALNDAARKSFSGCRVYMTPGVQALYQTQAIAARVQDYDDFTEPVCRQGFWDQWRPKLRESLAHLVG